MTQITTQTRRLQKEVSALHQEMSILRSLLISLLGRDREGEYRPEFVKQILKAAEEKPVYEFTDTQSFVAKLRT